MYLRQIGIAMTVVAGVSLSQGLYAAPLPAPSVPLRAMFGAAKMVSFSVRNDSANPLKFQCGEQTISVAPGQTAKVKVPPGSKLTFAEAFGDRAAGSVLTTADPVLNGTTLSVH